MEYLAIGSNMLPEQMNERGLSHTNPRAVIIPNWKFGFAIESRTRPGFGAATITPVEDSERGLFAQGVLYTIPDHHIFKMDEFEGYPTQYFRTRVFVQELHAPDSPLIASVAYVPHPSRQLAQDLTPHPDYAKRIVDGAHGRLTEDYVEQLKHWHQISMREVYGHGGIERL